MRYVISIVFINFLILTAPPVYADDDGGAVLRAGVHAAFHEFERQMIYKYFKGHVYEPVVYEERGGPPKKKGLPPGIQKKLARGGTLPPGIAKQYLPDGLIKQLPPPPHGYERRIVGSDVLLVAIDTGVIADIITDAILGD
jgi:Ni/Co efflux regulator RcnB